jgi:elongation factor Ts
MMDCKSALDATGGEMEAAVDWLRKKGLAKAAKKSGRVAAEGLVAAAIAPNGAGAKGVLVEVNSETDFVARNELFQSLVKDVARIALSTSGSVDAVRAATFPGADKSVEARISELVGQVGENMTLRRSGAVSVGEGVVSAYVHGQATEGAGRIGVLVGLQSAGDKAKLEALGRQIAMHVAAAKPLAARVSELDAAVVQRERDILADQSRGSGKSEEIIQKMVEGRLRKFYEESVLLEQVFVIDGETRISAVIENAGKAIGAPISLAGFVRLELGEGVDRTSEEE